MPRVSRAAATIAASSSGSTNGTLSTRTPIPSARRRSAAASARETSVPTATTVTSSPSVSCTARPGSNGAPSGVTSGTLKRGTRRYTGPGAAAAQRTAARVWAGSAGTTTGRLAIARVHERSSME